jgi:hypothetical protein
MTATHALCLKTRGGVHDLSRVVGVFALLNLTPTHLRVGPCGDGLRISARLIADERTARLCRHRFEALFAVEAATMRPLTGVAATRTATPGPSGQAPAAGLQGVA